MNLGLVKFNRAVFSTIAASISAGILFQHQSAIAESISQIPRLSDQKIEPSSTDARSLLAQTNTPIQITNSNLRSTETGFSLELQTATGEALQNSISETGNTLTIEIPNAQIQQELRRENPIAGITAIEIRNQTPEQVRITIVGIDGVPTGQVTSTQAGLTIAIAPAEPEEEVVVTAQKRPEPAQDTPVSLTVIPKQTLEDAQINSFQSIANNTPNFGFFPTTAGSPDFNYYSIRGLNNFNFLASQDSVGFYLDDVPFDFGAFLDLGLLDLERVEVLRGPQSTLYGRSSPAGVVNVLSRQPTNTPEVRVSGSYGSYNFREVQLSLSDAIVPNLLAFRLAGAYRARDGLFENDTLNRTVGDHNQLLGRAQLLWTPSKEWSVSFNSYISDNDNGDPVFSVLDGSDPFRTRKAVDGFVRLNTNTQALRISYDGAGFRATSITARRSSNQQALVGDTFVPGQDTVRSRIDFDSTVWSQEIRLQSPRTADRLRWLLGGYYESRDFKVGSDAFDYTAVGAAFFGLPSAGVDRVSAEQSRSNYAIFGQLDYKPIDPLTLFAGLRYESSRLELSRRRTFETSTGITLTPGSEVNGAEENSHELIPRFGVQYRFSPAVMAYATAAKGYRPSGFNYRADSEASRRFGEETTWTYEAGLKTSWFNDRLTANLSVFHSDVDGYQVLLTDNFGFFRNVVNANVKATGLEFELRGQPARGLEVIAGLGYVNSEFKNYRNPLTGSDFSNNRVPFAPDLTYNLALQYRSAGGIFARAELRGFGTTFFDDANRVKQAPFALLNLRLGYEWSNYGVYVYANNLTNARYITSGFLFPPPTVTAGLGEPVTFGFQVRANF